MKCTVKKEVEVTLKLTGDEAELLKDLFAEIQEEHIEDILKGFNKETIKNTVKLTLDVYKVLYDSEL